MSSYVLSNSNITTMPLLANLRQKNVLEWKIWLKIDLHKAGNSIAGLRLCSV